MLQNLPRPKSKAHIELHYLPCQAFFSALIAYDLCLEVHETYQKRSFRNKCMLASAQGVTKLTVPLKAGKHQQLPIREVEISYAENWPLQHLRTIRTCYESAPYFDHYIDPWQNLLHQNFPYLIDLNLAILDLFCTHFGISPEYRLSETYQKEVQIDLRQTIHPRNYSQYGSEPYMQVFSDTQGYLPNLSALDLLFCTGPAARTYLASDTHRRPRSL